MSYKLSPYTLKPGKVVLHGKVALEEAFNLPRLEAQTTENIRLYTNPEREQEYHHGITNIEDRVHEARRTGVGYTICSLTVPGAQGERDVKAAEALVGYLLIDQMPSLSGFPLTVLTL